MKNRAILALILSVALLFTSIPFVIFAEGEAAVAEKEYYTFADGMGKEEIPYGAKAPIGSWYDYKNFKMMDKTQAASAGVPDGYSGWVLAVDPVSGGTSIGLDLTDIKVADIEKITIRVWVPAGTSSGNGIRISNGAADWILLAPCTPGQWNEIVLDENQNFNTATKDFTVFDDGNGYCKPVNFCLRNAGATAYIDHIKVELKEKPIDPELGKAEIPYTDEDTTLSIYGYSAMNLLDAAKAEKAGITGIEGDYVMQFDNSTTGDTSFMLDLRQSVCKDVKIEDVESVTLRVWIPHKMDLRIRSVEGNDWQYIASHTPAEGGGWIKITITDMSTFVDDGNGYFSPFAFTFRNNWNPGSPCIVYFDGVTVKLKNVKTHYTFEEGMGKDEIPYGGKAAVGTYYGYSSFMMMNGTQAKAAGVPGGYSGWVLALEPNSGSAGIGLDLTNIKTKDIEKITFRVWCPTGTKQDAASGGIRLSGNTADTWNMLAAPSALNEWIDVVLEKDDFSSLDFDGDGYCDPMNFGFRGATSTAYIDHITVDVRDPDTQPPVITYNGETVIETREGRDFVLDITAHDAYDDVEIIPEYIWSEGALDENGKPVAGTHTCTVKATDEAGNTAEIVLTVNVGERDTEAPVLLWQAEDLFVMAGTLPQFDISATDNVDDVEVVLTWSEGALDNAGKLCAGTHTLTVSATDLSGNKTEVTVNVFVISGRPVVGNIVQDTK